MKEKILLGMSGGTDSSMSVLYLKELGYDVVGVTFLFSGAEDNATLKGAADLAEGLNVDHRQIDMRDEFKERIINYFVDEYKAARTPFPCAICNREVKWPQLFKLANELGCHKIATGHYAGIASYNGYPVIAKAADPDKDQSFFLWSIPKEILPFIVFPLNNLLKTDVRIKAADEGLSDIATKKDSMGICFIEEDNYREFLGNHPDMQGISDKGNFVDLDGTILGEHEGLHSYTIGQRRGLGLNVNKPLFVKALKSETNQVVLSDFKDLFESTFSLKDWSLFVPFEMLDGLLITIRIRYRGQHATGYVTKNGNLLDVKLENPEWGITPGQTAVFYLENLVLGGGFIK